MADYKKAKPTGASVIKPGTPEYEIAIQQMHRLKAISEQRLFSPEEYKLYDILVKSMKLLQDSPDDSITAQYKLEDNDVPTLIKLATGDTESLKDGREPTIKVKAITSQKPTRGDS